MGSQEYVERLAQERLDDEERLWNAISWVPDLQCAWQILVQCARDLVATTSCGQCPPSQSEVYAIGNDDGMSTMHALLGGFTGTPEQKTRANMIALLPTGLEGLGLRVRGAIVPRSVLGLMGGRFADGGGHVAHRCRSDPEISGSRRPGGVFGRVASSRAHVGPPWFRRSTNVGTVEVWGTPTSI